jgi:large subunit ribosomal protein L4
MALTVDVLNEKGAKVSTVDLAEGVFNVKAPRSLIHEVVNAYLANVRRGTHSTKTRGEVSGGGLKPWKQKHTGRARAGSNRSPLWRHGGIIFGPKPRSYFQPVPLAKRRLALRAVLSDFAKEGRIKVLNGFGVAEPKTKAAAGLVKTLGIAARSVVVVDQVSPILARAVRNLADVQLCRAKDLNSYGALLAKELVFTQSALEQITERLTDAPTASPSAGGK